MTMRAEDIKAGNTYVTGAGRTFRVTTVAARGVYVIDRDGDELYMSFRRFTSRVVRAVGEERKR